MVSRTSCPTMAGSEPVMAFGSVQPAKAARKKVIPNRMTPPCSIWVGEYQCPASSARSGGGGMGTVIY